MDFMNDLLSLGKVIREIGPVGLVLWMWFIGYRDQQKVLRRYQADMQEQRRMYENNVELVKQVTKIAEQQQDVILLNTRILQSLVDRIDSNQFCPMMRPDLRKIGGPDSIRP